MNDNNVSLFNFKDRPVRVVSIDGNPWFSAADICLLLDIYVKTPAGGVRKEFAFGHLKRRLNDKDYQRITLTTNRGKRGAPFMMAVSEAALYKIIMKSRSPEAEAFQNWIAEDVLPAIRKDGGYIKGEEQLVDPKKLDVALARVISAKRDKITFERQIIAGRMSEDKKAFDALTSTLAALDLLEAA